MDQKTTHVVATSLTARQLVIGTVLVTSTAMATNVAMQAGALVLTPWLRKAADKIKKEN